METKQQTTSVLRPPLATVTVFIIAAAAITLAGCDTLFNGIGRDTGGTDDSDASDSIWSETADPSSALLASAPSTDLSEYDISVATASRSGYTPVTAIRAVGDPSAGAGLAKATRNRAIAFSRKTDYIRALIQVLDAHAETVSFTEGTRYYTIDGFTLPFLGGETVSVTLRSVTDEQNGRLAVDVAVGGQVTMQVYVEATPNAPNEAAVVQVWAALGEPQDVWERVWVQVDTTTADQTTIDYRQQGQAAVSDETNLAYAYQGTLVRDDSGAAPVNTASGAFAEDFTGGEDFAYEMGLWNRFDAEIGSTYALQTHIRPTGQDTYGPQSWSVGENTIIDELQSPYHTAAVDVQSQGTLPALADDFSVPSVEVEWVTPWDGAIPETVEAVAINFAMAPLDILPQYTPWDKNDDVTSATDPSELPTLLAEVD